MLGCAVPGLKQNLVLSDLAAREVSMVAQQSAIPLSYASDILQASHTHAPIEHLSEGHQILLYIELWSMLKTIFEYKKIIDVAMLIAASKSKYQRSFESPLEHHMSEWLNQTMDKHHGSASNIVALSIAYSPSHKLGSSNTPLYVNMLNLMSRYMSHDIQVPGLPPLVHHLLILNPYAAAAVVKHCMFSPVINTTGWRNNCIYFMGSSLTRFPFSELLKDMACGNLLFILLEMTRHLHMLHCPDITMAINEILKEMPYITKEDSPCTLVMEYCLLHGYLTVQYNSRPPLMAILRCIVIKVIQGKIKTVNELILRAPNKRRLGTYVNRFRDLLAYTVYPRPSCLDANVKLMEHIYPLETHIELNTHLEAIATDKCDIYLMYKTFKLLLDHMVMEYTQTATAKATLLLGICVHLLYSWVPYDENIQYSIAAEYQNVIHDTSCFIKRIVEEHGAYTFNEQSMINDQTLLTILVKTNYNISNHAYNTFQWLKVIEWGFQNIPWMKRGINMGPICPIIRPHYSMSTCSPYNTSNLDWLYHSANPYVTKLAQLIPNTLNAHQSISADACQRRLQDEKDAALQRIVLESAKTLSDRKVDQVLQPWAPQAHALNMVNPVQSQIQVQPHVQPQPQQKQTQIQALIQPPWVHVQPQQTQARAQFQQTGATHVQPQACVQSQDAQQAEAEVESRYLTTIEMIQNTQYVEPLKLALHPRSTTKDQGPSSSN